jgi:hypothetical protein
MKCLCGEDVPIPTMTTRGRTRQFCSDRCANVARKRAQRSRDRNVTDKVTETPQDIRFYCGVGEPTFNHHPVHTGPYACVSPVSGRGGVDKHGKKKTQKRNRVCIPLETREVILDSGAFSDTTYLRCTFEEALHRQLVHARDFDYLKQVSHFADYDVLIDEQDRNGERIKARWDVDMADFAVSQTILAAQYMDSQRQYINQQVGHLVGLVLSAQGVDAAQYLRCAEKILPYVDPERDIFGLGGWCILGMQPKLLPTFFETMNTLIPMLKKNKIKRVHIWGVCFAEALGPLLFLCDHYQRPDGFWGIDEENRIQLSTDSVGPTTRMVKELKHKPGYASWGYASWHETVPLAHVEESCKQVNEQGEKAPACQAGTYCRGLERARHVDETIKWLARFREREQDVYRYVTVEEPAYKQASLFDEAV